ncbi:hypothetical protein I4U23_024727 [Adineta vaga]|nr:hypothetical protein I4U23_024727 [Adineta vaga]
MQSIISFCLLCLLILELTLNVTPAIIAIRNADNEGDRMVIIRRLHAPLMGRSVRTTLEDGGVGQFDSSGNFDENEKITLSKRRYSFAVLGGRSWLPSRKRGPLFG